MHLAAQHSKLNMVQFLLYRGLTANCRNIHNQSPDVVVGEKTRNEAEKKSNKKIRHILQENGKLQKKLAKHYKGARIFSHLFFVHKCLPRMHLSE